jgi:hypothetical protein
MVRTTKGLCWTVRILAFAAVWSFKLKVTVIEGLAVTSCDVNQTERGFGLGAVLVKVVMLIILAWRLFQPSPMQSPV